MASSFKSYGTQNIGVSTTTVYTAPALTTTTVIGLSISNTLTSTVIYVDVTAVKGGTSTYLIKNAPVAPGGALIVIGGDQKVVLETGNLIQVKSNTATSADVFVSMLEQT